MLHCYRAGSRDAAYKYKNLWDIKFQLKGVLAEVALCSWLVSKHKVKRFLSFATKLLSSHHQPFFVRVSSQSRFLHQRHKKNSGKKNIEEKLQNCCTLGGSNIHVFVRENLKENESLSCCHLHLWAGFSPPRKVAQFSFLLLETSLNFSIHTFHIRELHKKENEMHIGRRAEGGFYRRPTMQSSFWGHCFSGGGFNAVRIHPLLIPEHNVCSTGNMNWCQKSKYKNIYLVLLNG